MRRKGERPLPITLDHWDDNHTVADMIRTGSRWFDAWVMQKATPYVRLSALTGIPQNRLMALSLLDDVTRAEIDALARAWSVSSNDLIASIGGRVKVVN